MSTVPGWIDAEDALLFHDEMIASFGGAAGVRDAGLLDSALSRPRNAFGYGTHDRHVLAAAYAYGIVQNHPFVDGNKRTSFVITRVFLGLEGISFDPPEDEAVTMVEGLAAGEVTQEDFADWVRRHSG